MRRRFWIGWLGIVAVLAGAVQLGVRWNVSPSLAPGFYLERQREAVHGDLVLVCLPEPVGRWARQRGYLRHGRCPGGSQPLGKRISGIESDRVEIYPDTIAINGRRLDGSRRVKTDKQDRPMPLAGEGVVVLERGKIWLHSGRHPRSLDSRIYGALDRSAIQAVLDPLWTAREP